jgi:AcrR family transcriptional regulator
MSTSAAELTSFPRSSINSGQVSAILAAAESCFSRLGYAGASMREIADQARVSKSLLHYHFRSKEHLFVEVQIRAYERLAARVTSTVSSIQGGAERGLAAFDALFAALRDGSDLTVQAELWSAAISNEALREQVVRLREFSRELLVGSVERILGADGAKLPTGPEGAADLVWATLNGLAIARSYGEPTERMERCIATLRALVGAALARGQRR